jgi:GTP-binding protein Era
LEALFGAIFLDSGFDAAKEVIRSLYAPVMIAIDPTTLGKDAKTLLQEFLQSKKIALPQYNVVATHGAAHNQEFEIACLVPKLDIQVFGTGGSRRAGEQAAAKLALEAAMLALAKTPGARKSKPRAAQLKLAGIATAQLDSTPLLTDLPETKQDISDSASMSLPEADGDSINTQKQHEHSMNELIDNPDFRCGYIAIVGRPNVGKSTLMNALIGAKVSITSRKAQTTRHRITGIQTKDNTQFVYVDTPGFQTRHSNALNRTLNRTVTTTLTAADVILFLVEAGTFGPADQQVIDLLPKNVPCILVINKSDRIKDKAVMMPFAQKVAALFPFAAIVPVSATLRFQLENLEGETRKYLPLNPPMFAEDDITDRSEKFLATEIVREKLFRFVGDELPYTSTVLIEKFEQEGNLRRIFVAILVDRDGHKSMVIGNKGARLKDISTQSRVDMEKLFGGPVYLEIWVKVKSGWADNEAGLRAYGYE